MTELVKDNREPRAWLFLGLVLTVVLTTYSEALSAPFLWDDHQLIEDDILGTERSWVDHFTQPFWRGREWGAMSRGYFRPITTLSYAWDASWTGNNPVGFHLTNLILHLGVVGALIALARRLGAGWGPSLLGALAFGVMPRLTESVTWISGRTDLLAGLLGLITLLLYPLPGATGRALVRSVPASLAFALSLLAKEIGLAFLVALAVIEARSVRRGRSELRESLLCLAPFFVGLVGYLALRSHVLDSSPAGQTFYGGPRVLASLEALGHYACMLIDFLRPRTQIGDAAHPSYLFASIGAVVLMLLLIAGARAYRRASTQSPSDGVLLGGTLATAALLPVLHLVPVPVNVIAADRFLYVFLIGLTLAAVSATSELGARGKRVFQVAVLALSFAGIAGTVVRNRDYQSELAFWLAAVHTTPAHNSLPLHELARVYAEGREPEVALELHTEAARRQRPRFALFKGLAARASSDLVSALSALGRYDEAVALGERMLVRGFTAPREIFSVALAYVHRSEFQRARELTQYAFHLLPSFSAARDLLTSLPALEAEAALLPGLTGREHAVRRARYHRRIGARVEAERDYLELLRQGERDREVQREALGFLISFGSVQGLARAVESMDGLDPVMETAITRRFEESKALAAALPEIAPYRTQFETARLGL